MTGFNSATNSCLRRRVRRFGKKVSQDDLEWNWVRIAPTFMVPASDKFVMRKILQPLLAISLKAMHDLQTVSPSTEDAIHLAHTSSCVTECVASALGIPLAKEYQTMRQDLGLEFPGGSERFMTCHGFLAFASASGGENAFVAGVTVWPLIPGIVQEHVMIFKNPSVRSTYPRVALRLHAFAVRKGACAYIYCNPVKRMDKIFQEAVSREEVRLAPDTIKRELFDKEDPSCLVYNPSLLLINDDGFHKLCSACGSEPSTCLLS